MSALHPSAAAAIAEVWCKDNPSSVFEEFKAAVAEAEPMKVFIPEYEFNDDDVYLYNVATSQLIRHYAISSHEVFCARYGGVKMREGQAWAKGRNARDLKLWRAV